MRGDCLMPVKSGEKRRGHRVKHGGRGVTNDIRANVGASPEIGLKS